MADVIVIGAGVVGALQAFRLSGRGHRVTVLDPRGPCRGASGATFAWTSAHGKRPLFYHLFSLAAAGRHRALGEELGVDYWWRPTFSLRPALEEEGWEDVYADTMRRQMEGYHLSWVDGAEARRLAPLLTPRAVGASLCEGEGLLNPFRLVFAALDAARRNGAALRFGEAARGIATEGGRVTGVRTDRGLLPCGAVVNAAGIDAPALAATAGAPVPFERVKGEILLTEKLPPRLNAVVGEVTQTFSGNFLLGASQEPGRTDAASTLPNLRRIARRACEMFPALARVRLIRSYAGVRPMPTDGVSLVGPTARCEGLYFASTHSGITLAPLLAEIVADFLEGRRHPLWDERLSPDRFLSPEETP